MEVNAIQPAGISKVSDSCKHTYTHTFTLEISLQRQLTLDVKISLHAKFSVTMLCNWPDPLSCSIWSFNRVSVINLASLASSPWLPRNDKPTEWSWSWEFLLPLDLLEVKNNMTRIALNVVYDVCCFSLYITKFVAHCKHLVFACFRFVWKSSPLI